MQVMGLDQRLRADEMDRVLAEGRRTNGRGRVSELPDGAMFAVEDQAFAVRGGAALPWSFGGYGPAQALPSWSDVEVLTCEPIRWILVAGFRPRWHPSGGG